MEKKFTLRLPKRLNEKVVSEAKAEHRSKNDQIIQILEERYNAKSAASPQQAASA